MNGISSNQSLVPLALNENYGTNNVSSGAMPHYDIEHIKVSVPWMSSTITSIGTVSKSVLDRAVKVNKFIQCKLADAVLTPKVWLVAGVDDFLESLGVMAGKSSQSNAVKKIICTPEFQTVYSKMVAHFGNVTALKRVPYKELESVIKDFVQENSDGIRIFSDVLKSHNYAFDEEMFRSNITAAFESDPAMVRRIHDSFIKCYTDPFNPVAFLGGVFLVVTLVAWCINDFRGACAQRRGDEVSEDISSDIVYEHRNTPDSSPISQTDTPDEVIVIKSDDINTSTLNSFGHENEPTDAAGSSTERETAV